MAYIKIIEIVEKLAEDTIVRIDFCWGKKRSLYNTGRAFVLIKSFRKALKENNLKALADAFNTTINIDANYLSQLVALMNILRNWDVLRKCEVE